MNNVELNSEITERCDEIFCPELPTECIISSEIWNDIQELFYYFYPDEFAIFLKGHVENSIIYITDYVVPLQKVFPGYVEINEVADLDVIGHLHSHGYLAPFFSGEDLDHLNYNVHLVIGSQKPPIGIARKKTSCGHNMQRMIKVSLNNDTYQT